LKKPEPTFISFGVQYPDNPGFCKHSYYHITPQDYLLYFAVSRGSENDVFSQVIPVFVNMPINKEDYFDLKFVSA